MVELRRSLYALVEHPPVPPVAVEVVAARGARLVRRRRILGGAVGLALVAIVSTIGLAARQQNREPAAVATGTAGPPVSYTDPAGDASASATLSGATFDIVLVEWAPAAGIDEARRGGYSTSITVAGTARDDVPYVSYGVFPSDVPGEECELYHFLTPGTTAFANAFCGSTFSGTRRSIGRVQGGPVVATSTAAGGTLLVATFDDIALPPLLQAAGRELSRLSAFTCAVGSECAFVDQLDIATSSLRYRL